MTTWGWRPERTEGIWHHGAPALRPLVSSAPWLTLGLLVLLFSLLNGAFVSSRGILFDLPSTELDEGAMTGGPVALLMPHSHETLVFFDDSRYVLGDLTSQAALSVHLKEVASQTKGAPLLALVDRRIGTGEVLEFTALARQSGIRKVLFAEQKASEDE